MIRFKKHSCYFSNQREATYTFSRALHRLQMTSSLDWFTGLAVCFVIGQNDYFNLLLASQHLIENQSYQQLVCNSITMTVTDHQKHNQPGEGGGGTSLYGPLGFVQSQRACFLALFVINRVPFSIIFVSNRVWLF